jgi:tetratricopeptide (TPR) repeat protein
MWVDDADAGETLPEHGSMPSRASDDPDSRVGERLGRYVLGQRVGSGSMGTVYAATDPSLHRTVAIKVLHRTAAASGKLSARLLREARALARLNHPNVVTVTDVGEQDGTLWVAMELVQGQTLRAWLAAERRSWPEILAAFLAAGEGLAAAHLEGLVHRDFKPANVMMADDGRVLVMDFGIVLADLSAPSDAAGSSVSARMDLHETGASLGTPAYMAPEQIRRARVDERSDQFNYCVAFLEALDRTHPFHGETALEIMAAVSRGERRSAPAPHGPRWLRRALERGLAAEPADRWPTMAVLLRTLRRHNRRQRNAAGLAAGAALGALAGAIALWATTPDRDCSSIASRLALPEGSPQHAAEAVHAWARRWEVARVANCEAARASDAEVDAGAIDRARTCLERRHADAEALVAAIAQADAGAREAAAAIVSQLPRLSECDSLDDERDRLLPADPAQAERVPAVEAVLRRAKGMRLAGDYAEALQAVEALDAELATLDFPPARVEANVLRAALLLDTGAEPARARALAEPAYLEAERLGLTRLATEAALWVARAAWDAGDERELDLWSKRGLALADRLGDPSTYANFVSYAGMAARLRGEPEEAARLLAKAVGHLRDHAPDDAFGLATALTRQGLALDDLGRFAEAAVLHEEALELRIDLLGEDHPLVGASHMNVGANAWRRGEADRAIAQTRRALAIKQRVHGDAHASTARTRMNLGAMLAESGDRVAAYAELAAALAALEVSLGPDHRDTAMARMSVGLTLVDIGRTDEGIAATVRAAADLEAAIGPDHPETLAARAAVGRARELSGELEDAVRDYASVAADTLQVLGAGHPDLAKVLCAQGGALSRLGRQEQALDRLDEGLRQYALSQQPATAGEQECADLRAQALTAREAEQR